MRTNLGQKVTKQTKNLGGEEGCDSFDLADGHWGGEFLRFVPFVSFCSRFSVPDAGIGVGVSGTLEKGGRASNLETFPNAPEPQPKRIRGAHDERTEIY